MSTVDFLYLVSGLTRGTTCRRLNTAGAELAKGLLHYDPAKRLTADQALESPFFSTEEPAPEIPTQYVIGPGRIGGVFR